MDDFFFVKYEYGDFIHVFRDELLQLTLRLQCMPICSHLVAWKCEAWHHMDFSIYFAKFFKYVFQPFD